MLLTLVFLLQAAQPADPWRLVSVPASSHVLERSGDVLTAEGASATIRATNPAASSGVLTRTFSRMDSLRLTRVEVTGEMRTKEIGSASVWLRIDGPDRRRVGWVNAMETSLRGTTDWTPFRLTYPIVQEAEQAVIGIAAVGNGEASVRNVRIRIIPLPAADTPLSPVARAMLDSTFSIVKRESVWRDTVTWAVVEPALRRLAAGAQTAADIHPIIQILLDKLGDNHSTFMPPARATAFATGGGDTRVPNVRVLDGGIGYIPTSSYFGGEPAGIRQYTDSVHQRLIQSAQLAKCGWVVDLRTNVGGNMNPMLMSLQPFLGSEPLGYFIRADGSRTPWSAGPAPRGDIGRVLAPLESARVAVLYGSRTASSGEIVAISFRGRPRSRSFGSPTGGYSTANAMHPLPDGSRINLTGAIDADRTGFRYGGKVLPDVEVPLVRGDTADITLRAATDWLSRECSASSVQGEP